MANIVKLRMAGFKSFMEAAEFGIDTGLTGVVGPNGCGKSNVVEAFRWAMGETSAKQLRGGGMDDVIFAGAAGRPSRNHAEVSISMSDPDGEFPMPWVGQTEIEISRKIERGGGSTYRVNGRETRARDVQTLFADLASGARSAAIVSQGQIGAFVIAKPEQRRAILEEAAGVAGLRARRHEATLRLNAAEANLERLEDVLLGFDNQLDALRKQARQAGRFRRLSDLIRAAEASAFIARWRIGESALAEAAEGAKAAERAVAEAVAASAAAERLATEAAAALPAARKEEAEAAAGQQRLRIELERIEAERRRRADARAAAKDRLSDVARDKEREEARKLNAKSALERLAEESVALDAAAAELADPTGLDARIAAQSEDVTAKTRAANAAADAAASLEAVLRAAQNARQDAATRAARAAHAVSEAERAHAKALAAAPSEDATKAAAEAEAAARATVERLQTATEQARAAAEAARALAADARDARATADQARAGLAAEVKTLSTLLAKGKAAAFAPAVDHMRAASGYETALGAALGDDLEAALDPAAQEFWVERKAAGTDASLPPGGDPLSQFVDGPAALKARLDQTGVVADQAAGAALADRLAMGQRLVSKDGAVWRWDGFTRQAGAETSAARRLALQNQLKAAEASLAEAAASADASGAKASEAIQAAKSAEALEREASEKIRSARRDAETRAAERGRLERAASSHAAGLAAKTEALARDRQQAEEAQEAAAAIEARAAVAEDPTAAKAEAERLRGEAGAAQIALAEARAERQRLESAKNANASRRQAVAAEVRQWREAESAASDMIQALLKRAEDAEAAIANAAEGDAGEDQKRAGLLDALELADARRRTLADALAKAEADAVTKAAGARAAESAAGSAREARVGANALVEQARTAVQAFKERIEERLDATPEDLAEIAGTDPEAVSGDLDALDRKVERLRRERETMGAVNLRAETEIEEIESQSGTIRTEREDLTAAIAKLRRGVAELSGEARQRIRAAFDQIDAEFSTLFVRLFGGGKARLALVGSDDPLEAGLEIMASPPGKSLQTLSLLSGGERALTALALVFAAFKVNPSPICVLDEVDAPLDDSNVDRLCTLLEEMAESGHTRFLVVTHHRMTMARMHRLYGVTMPERGVSQLVSVDFDAAQAMREAV